MRLPGAANCSAPSRKNGRFSGYESALRGSNWIFAASDSTWEKSGFTVPLRVRSVVMPKRALPPHWVACRS